MNKIAVLITCHNRIEKTTRCLTNLYQINKDISVFLVDDDSADNTSDIISKNFPNVKIIRGNGKLFWNRGMHLAWEKAVSSGIFDYFFWLNDDVVLYQNSLNEMLSCSEATNKLAIISGILESPNKKNIIYGGYDSQKKILKPNDEMQEIMFLTGNVVLISWEIFQILGNLDPIFHHDLGDVDYGLRARKNQIRVLTTRVTVGCCEENTINRLRKKDQNLINRLLMLYSPLGSNPILTFRFKLRHFGILNAIVFFIYIHFINILPDSFYKIITDFKSFVYKNSI
jgi:GT2 family glycosyltransferase